MLTFAIAVAGTASLGLLAVRQPGILKHLNTFGLWAGLFVQIAGVVEALRRIATNPYGTFGIATASPQVAMAGATVGAATTAQRPKVAVHTPVADVSKVRAAPRMDPDRLDSVAEFLEKLTPKDFADDPNLVDLIDSKLEPFVHRLPDGSLDHLANQNDPYAARARALHYDAVRLRKIASEVTRPMSGMSFINKEE